MIPSSCSRKEGELLDHLVLNLVSSTKNEGALKFIDQIWVNENEDAIAQGRYLKKVV